MSHRDILVSSLVSIALVQVEQPTIYLEVEVTTKEDPTTIEHEVTIEVPPAEIGKIIKDPPLV